MGVFSCLQLAGSSTHHAETLIEWYHVVLTHAKLLLVLFVLLGLPQLLPGPLLYKGDQLLPHPGGSCSDLERSVHPNLLGWLIDAG